MHISDALVDHDRHSPTTPRAVRFCIENLETAKASYPLAGPLQRMFATAVTDCGLDLPDDLQRFVGLPTMYQLDELMNACGRPTYKTPMSQLVPTLRKELAQEFMDEWARASEGANGKAKEMEVESPAAVRREEPKRGMQISALLND